MSNLVCKIPGGGILRGTVKIPPSKSAAHRAMLCAALADGRSVLSPIELSNDMKATLNAVTALGAKADLSGDTLAIDGIGGRFGSADNEPTDINCIESGSTLRFIIPIACAAGINGRFIGEGTLVTRPIGLYSDLLPQAGVECFSQSGLPLVCKGKLQSGKYEIPGNISSQFITGMLMALPLCDGDSFLRLTTPLQSSAYVDMTIRCMADFGVKVIPDESGWFIPGGQHYSARDYTVEGDWSQAGFFLAAGAMGSELTLRGLRLDSAQGDKAAVELFRNFGAEIDIDGTEIHVRAGKRLAQHINAGQIPDLVPCLAVCAALCEGTTIIDHAERLRIKESDRLTSTAAMIHSLGGKAQVTDDGLIIEGIEKFTGGVVDGFRDHRIVMSAAIGALCADGEVTITTPHSVSKSYPSFFEVYNSLGGKANVIDMGQ
ncbi:MAG: 3-phosphoshikimate 1-carboxyvinyltransferase [Clostridia bacterium]|nr:3-phosphoshikimate 1-carboxyvinyltransferase [Clostridia bacterium]